MKSDGDEKLKTGRPEPTSHDQIANQRITTGLTIITVIILPHDYNNKNHRKKHKQKQNNQSIFFAKK